MQYKRKKPNSGHWQKTKPVDPESGPNAPIFSDREVAVLLATTRALDEMCAINGHRFRGDIYPGKTVCATCDLDRKDFYHG